MQLRILALAAALTVSGTAASEARAQAAAEEAVVLSGTSAGTSRASRDLGNAVGGTQPELSAPFQGQHLVVLRDVPVAVL